MSRPGAPASGVKAAVQDPADAVGSVTSKDGTAIGYRQLGRGPGLVLLHGAMESARSHVELAQALADAFTVYLPDRRGRGRSGPPGKDHVLRRDVEDLEALLVKTGARNVFGVSSGGIVCLEAALTLPAAHKAALFEPPLVVDGAVSTGWLARYDEEMAQGKVAAALVTGMKGTRMGPPLFDAFPRRLLEKMTAIAMRREERKATREDVTMRALAPTLRHDVKLVEEASGDLERFRAVRAEVLLLGGSRSPAYLRTALDALEGILPRVRRTEMPGLGHGASGNADRGGRPEKVAEELRRFFA